MARKRVQVRREEILSVTVAQIEQVGIEALRISDVAARLGISPGLTIYHFQTKDNLIAEAFRYAAERDLLKVRRLMSESKPMVERLLNVLRWYSPTGRAKGWRLWIDGWGAAMHHPTMASVIGDLDVRWKQAVAELIREGVTEGTFDVADADDAATRITALLDGFAVQTLVHRRGVTRDRMAELLRRQLAWELGVEEKQLRAAS